MAETFRQRTSTQPAAKEIKPRWILSARAEIWSAMYWQGWLTFLIQVIYLSAAESQTLAITYWLPYAERCCSVLCHWRPHTYRSNSRGWGQTQVLQGQLPWHWIIYLRS